MKNRIWTAIAIMCVWLLVLTFWRNSDVNSIDNLQRELKSYHDSPAFLDHEHMPLPDSFDIKPEFDDSFKYDAKSPTFVWGSILEIVGLFPREIVPSVSTVVMAASQSSYQQYYTLTDSCGVWWMYLYPDKYSFSINTGHEIITNPMTVPRQEVYHYEWE